MRTIKPEFPTSESMGRCEIPARLMYIEMWTIADDEGRLRGSLQTLRAGCFPFDDKITLRDLARWLYQLQAEGCLQVYRVERATYIQLLNFSKHQRPQHPTASRLPKPPKKGQGQLALLDPQLIDGDSAQHVEETDVLVQQMANDTLQ